MKKFFALLASVLLLSGIASAQPRAIGIRAGWGYELSFQYTFVDYQFLEVDLGPMCGPLNRPLGFRLTGTYNFIFSQPQWTERGTWGWYAGLGAMMGVYHQSEGNHDYFVPGFVPVFGLEYTFWFPLQVSLDVRPTIGAMLGKSGTPLNKEFYMDGIKFGFIPALAVRYRF